MSQFRSNNRAQETATCPPGCVSMGRIWSGFWVVLAFAGVAIGASWVPHEGQRLRIVGEVAPEDARSLAKMHSAMCMRIAKANLRRSVEDRDWRSGIACLAYWRSRGTTLVLQQTIDIVYVEQRYSKRTASGYAVGRSYEHSAGMWKPVSTVETRDSL